VPMRRETLLPWPILTDARILILLFLISVPARAQETGEGLFKAKCGVCHGPDASGKTVVGQKLKAPDLHSADVQKKADAELGQLITKKGKEKMPAYEGKLSKEQIEKLVAFIREVGKKH
jgi:cytochrome c6